MCFDCVQQGHTDDVDATIDYSYLVYWDDIFHCFEQYCDHRHHYDSFYAGRYLYETLYL
jgi:hypothetical protein